MMGFGFKPGTDNQQGQFKQIQGCALAVAGLHIKAPYFCLIWATRKF